MPQLDGIDIYNGQGDRLAQVGADVDAIWEWLAGLNPRPSLAVCKSSQGASVKARDRYYPHWRDTTERLGFAYRGPFHWVTATSPIAAQFANFTAYVGVLRDGEFIQLDCEEAGLTDQMVLEAYDRWTQQYGDRVAVYMGRYFTPQRDAAGKTTYMIDRLPGEIPWWVAWYGPKDFSAVTLPRRPVIWQWGGGKEGVYVPVIDRRVDSNQIIDEDRLRLLCGYPEPDPVITNEEDDLPYSEDQLRQMIREEAWAAVIGVLRSPEVRGIIHEAAAAGASGPSTESP